MLPYSRGIILDNTNNYGIVKTETVFGFRPSKRDAKEALNDTEPLEWIITHENFERTSLSGETESRSLKKKTLKTETPIAQKRSKKKSKSKKSLKGKKKRKGKVKKCIYKIIKKAKKNKSGNKMTKYNVRYILPMILGIFAAKSLLIPIALKALAFLSAKGLMMGFFSTVMASVLSLKGMFDHSHGYANRKDDTKTQVEIIQVPAKTEDHYYDDHFKRGDFLPYNEEFIPIRRYETNTL